jgi:hypothetical protein
MGRHQAVGGKAQAHSAGRYLEDVALIVTAKPTTIVLSTSA